MLILSNYIEMTYYSYLNTIILICSLSTSSSNQHMTHQQLNSFLLHHLPHHLTHMVYIYFKFCFHRYVLCGEITQTRSHLHMF
jgi:hypothetical protein